MKKKEKCFICGQKIRKTTWFYGPKKTCGKQCFCKAHKKSLQN